MMQVGIVNSSQFFCINKIKSVALFVFFYKVLVSYVGGKVNVQFDGIWMEALSSEYLSVSSLHKISNACVPPPRRRGGGT